MVLLRLQIELKHVSGLFLTEVGITYIYMCKYLYVIPF